MTFTPRHLLLLVTNHKPHANSDDYAVWKRMLLIPFTQAFVDDPQLGHKHPRDANLATKLRSEAPGILAWLVRGCLEWQRSGLNPPAAVRAATDDYRIEEDSIAQFIAEKCLVKPGVHVKGREFYDAYTQWARGYGMKPMSMTKFGTRMTKRFTKRSTENGVVYEGVGLVDS